ncbi:uncharacterized protein LOC26528216 [Drosophila mojavensis]|uniref:Uncharacterized protein n=1 Tax=Drosophila mojavensis TaxID=7230 RepID=A0A0Q9XH23_DROMO|nr:uncharacterized protein LOC26528216 [Drosophila mojavensis]KRG02904.1 uncharacterized protein Dmoj_GI26575 [Drosophila mojavensis]
MAERASDERFKVLNSRKLELPLDEYYKQHVRPDLPNLNSSIRGTKNANCVFNTNVMDLTLDEYYEQFVVPKVKLQEEQAIVEQRSKHFQRTHYFGPRYLEQCQHKQKAGRAVQEDLENKIQDIQTKII